MSDSATLVTQLLEVAKGVIPHLWTLVIVPLEMMRQRISHHGTKLGNLRQGVKALDSDIDALQLAVGQTLTHQEVRDIIREEVGFCFERIVERMDAHHATIDERFKHNEDVAGRIERNIERRLREI